MSTQEVQLRVAMSRLRVLTQKLGTAPQTAQQTQASVLDAIEQNAELTAFGKQELAMAVEMKDYRALMYSLQDLQNDPKASATQKAQVAQELRKRRGKIEERQMRVTREAKSDAEKTRLRDLEQRWLSTKNSATKAMSYDGREELRPVSGNGAPTASTPLVSDLGSWTDGGSSMERDGEFQEFFQQVQQRNVQIDKLLDQIAAGVLILKDQAGKIHDELKVQEVIMNDTEKKVEKVTTKLQALNKKVKRAIKEVGRDKICIYAICCILLLGLVGFILYQTKVIK